MNASIYRWGTVSKNNRTLICYYFERDLQLWDAHNTVILYIYFFMEWFKYLGTYSDSDL